MRFSGPVSGSSTICSVFPTAKYWIFTEEVCRHHCITFSGQVSRFQLILNVFWNQKTAYSLCQTAWDFSDQFRRFQLILSVFWNHQIACSLCRTAWAFLDYFRGFQLILSVFWNMWHAVCVGLHAIFWISFEVFNWLLAYFPIGKYGILSLCRLPYFSALKKQTLLLPNNFNS